MATKKGRKRKRQSPVQLMKEKEDRNKEEILKKMKLSTLQSIDECTERLVHPSPYEEQEERILLMIANSCIRSEYEFFKLGIGLRVPYSMLLHILRRIIYTVPSDCFQPTYNSYMAEAGLHLLSLGRNAY